MINLYLNDYSTLYEVPDYFTITQVDKYVDVTIRLQDKDIYSTTLYEDGTGKAYFYGFRQLLAQNMEGRYLTLASLTVYAAHEDGMESYEDKYILFSKVFFYEEQGDFMKKIFLNTRSYYVVPRSEYMPLSLFMDGSEVPGLSGTAVFKMEDGKIYTYDFTRTTYNYNLPHIYYFYLCADAIQRQIEQAEGADSGELGTLVSFSVRAGKRSVTIYVTDEEPAIYFDFRNAFNVDERIFIYGTMKLKTSFDRKEASISGHTQFYNMSEERKYEVEISSEEQSSNDNYIEQKNLAYAECSHQMWKYYSCDWAIGQLPKVSWTNIAAMQSGLASYMDCAGPYNHRYYNSLHVCRAESSYYVLKCYRTQTINKVIHHYMRLQPVNMFGQKIVNRSEDAQVEELRIVPVCIDHTDMTRGDVIFMECGTLGDDTEDAEDKDENQTQAVNTISAGEKEKKEEFFDKIYVGFWDGNLRRTWPQMPIPIIDPYMMDQFNLLIQAHYSMRLTGAEKPETRTNNYHIDQSVKFTFKFLVKDGAIPDVRSIFYIHGKKYMAEKITATFSAETGMSQLLKMVCYRVL